MRRRSSCVHPTEIPVRSLDEIEAQVEAEKQSQEAREYDPSRFYHPAVTVDLVIFTLSERDLQVLLKADLVDEQKMRSFNLGPGDEVTVEAKHGFSGSSGFHHLKFPGGHRLDNAVSSGYFVILYNDKRSPGKVQAANYGHLTMPRNTVLK